MSLETTPLGEVVQLLMFTPGRRMFALNQTLGVAQGLGHEALEEAIRAALAHDREQTLPARLMYVRGRGGRKQTTPLVGLDNEADRLVTAIDVDLKGVARSFRDSNPLKARAVQVREAVLPEGAGAVTGLPFVEQHAALEQLVGALTGPWAEDAAALGLGPKVAALADVTAEYGEALSLSEASSAMTFAQYRSIDRVGQEHLLGVVARIVGLYPDEQAPAEALKARTALLAPILAQQALIRAHNRRSRSSAPDVNPDTGDVVDEPPVEPTPDA